MTDHPSERSDRDQAKQLRLRQALRDNLKKRKAQLRGRADLAAAAAGVSSELDTVHDIRPEPDTPGRDQID